MRKIPCSVVGGRQSSDKKYSTSQSSDNICISQISDKKMGTLQFSDTIEKETAYSRQLYKGYLLLKGKGGVPFPAKLFFSKGTFLS